MRANMRTLPGMTVGIIEVDNKVASKYIEENYEEILRRTAYMQGVDASKVTDLVHDVYISVVNAENNGEGFEIQVDDKVRSVSDFVYGRIKGYSKNVKYRTNSDNVEVAASGTCNADGDLTGCTKEQYAYEMAASYDDLEEIEARMAFSEELNYVLTFQSQVQIDLRMMLKNIGRLAEMTFDSSILGDVKSLMYRSEEFADAIKSVLRMYTKDVVMFEQAVAAI